MSSFGFGWEAAVINGELRTDILDVRQSGERPGVWRAVVQGGGGGGGGANQHTPSRPGEGGRSGATGRGTIFFVPALYSIQGGAGGRGGDMGNDWSPGESGRYGAPGTVSSVGITTILSGDGGAGGRGGGYGSSAPTYNPNPQGNGGRGGTAAAGSNGSPGTYSLTRVA